MKEPFAFQTPEMMRTANLMAHPAASVMALSALGFGMASHAMGNWLGAMSMAAEASQRFWQPLLAGNPAFREVVLPGAPRAASVAPEASVRPATPSEPASTGSAKVVALSKSPRGARPVKTVAPAQAEQPVAADAPVAAPRDVPARRDDLKAISGVGPKLEQVLNGLGISSYAQIAAWGESDIARVEDFLGFKGRIGRDDWIAQAAALAARSSGAEG